MATTVNCDLCKTEIKGPATVYIDGGVYRLEISPMHVPMGIKPLEDLCSRCLAKKIQTGAQQGEAA